MISRIDSISAYLDGYKVVCDIGTDHGYVIKSGFDNYKIEKAIAVDINPLPLESAKTNLTGYPVEFVLSDGFINVKSDFDVAVISGMGAALITEILKNRPTGNQTYIVSPNNNVYKLRKALKQLGLYITAEKLVYEKGHYYPILKLKNGYYEMSEEEIYCGIYLKNDILKTQYFKHEASKYEKIYKQVPKALKQEIKNIINYYQKGQ